MHFLRFILCVLTLYFIALYRVQKVRFYNAIFTAFVVLFVSFVTRKSIVRKR
ncbi:hypothetical protein HMPREF1579_00477 [Gardnerella vaginalis JCP8066]|nr:hypothetical protein HMPREF1582_01038 [Gardnerella vaginalis JCP8151A]EPI60397.1 hypothetical protein HMPREF1579_00477 [Gardnerella vaginalis JCP8066]